MSIKQQIRYQNTAELLMAAYPVGITTPSISEQLDVSRQTSHNDINNMQNLGYPIAEGTGGVHHYCINPRDYVEPLSLTLDQAWFLYLPLRRMARTQMNRYPVINSLLRKVTTSLDPKLGGVISEALVQETTDLNEDDHPFTTLIEAWRDVHQVEIRYKPLHKPESRHIIEPYWFEPATWTDSLYVIAGIVMTDDIKPATLKLERVLSADLRPKTFEKPDPKDILEYLSQTWSIWVGDEPEKVQLRFSNRARQRLLETRWHPSEKVIDEDDGSVLWEAFVLEPQEMASWIRGWGPEVEVLEPANLRQQVMLDAERTAYLYGVCENGESNSFFGMRRRK